MMPSDKDRPDGAPKVIDAEFEEAADTAQSGVAQPGEAQMVLVTAQDVVTDLATLESSLEGLVPEEVRKKIGLLGQFALATAQRQAEFERRLEKIQATQKAREQALAIFLAGGQLPEVVTGAVTPEKAPDKLRPLEIVTPSSVGLVTEKFTITLTNPNAEEVQADVSVTLQSFDGREDPVLECLVNPREGRTSGLTPKAIILGPAEEKQIEVILRSKLGKEGDPKPGDIIAEQMQVNVNLTPTDIDSSLEAREFPPIRNDVELNDHVGPIEKNEETTIKAGHMGGSYYGGYYLLEVAGIELKQSGTNHYSSETRLRVEIGSVLTPWTEPDRIKIMNEGLRHIQARTAIGHIPVRLPDTAQLNIRFQFKNR